MKSLEELLNRIRTESPDDENELTSDIIDDLSWMYFKTHRMDDGIALLEEALEDGFNRNWAHTLGTLYSGIYNLELSRYWYMQSIEDALDSGDEYFASVAYYNLSLLEFSFYRYDDAEERARRSLELRSRAGGHMVLGELEYMAWKLNEALESYRRAESLDDTPLSQVDIASFYRRIGYLDEALRFIDEVEQSDDESWMYHYGLDRLRFEMDLSGIRSESLLGKAAVESLTPRAGFLPRVTSLIRRTEWRIRGMYHDRRNRALTDRHATQLLNEGNSLDAAWNAAQAHRGYRRPALEYLEEARELEMVIAGESAPWYQLEIGVETNDTAIISEALVAFRPGEEDPVERSLREMAIRTGGRHRDSMAGESLSRLYAMNPGGLRQYGLSLPLTLAVTGDVPAAVKRRIASLLRGTGYTLLKADASVGDSSVLTVALDASGSLKWYMAAPDGRTRSSTETPVFTKRKNLAPILAGLLESFYATPLSGGLQ